MNYYDSLLLFNVLKAKPPVNDTQILINRTEKKEYYYYFIISFSASFCLLQKSMNYISCGSKGRISTEKSCTNTHTQIK